ncbi:acetolactate synthase [Rhodococcus sp. WS3]|uniref:thiamine pyrophosphate-binding protein n=1 Tax=unclassified Rhodococcus (in: high G+C Gram-positive bacteria) TaxID=192944 RepID=UPI0005D377D7|nr:MULTISPECIES: thiamine pyrophosphate-binding protein [unclassified Rhodococcus (in: high G+C Gram-positive bacteria)]KJF19189.1 Acetolactate synthase isozyme 2 large subunit [Rhodococcus sp. AD45]ROZ42823.1 acetolactate synthase [Rhodococcus sp. WS3]RZL20787.1 MAG: acetolactate synthase [Rhodococcus sp. (in: high G+C Gram-positive bacteria)]
MKEQVSGGAAVVDALAAHGVTDVFGIPGTHNLEIYRYLPASGIRHVVTRHEQGAGYAADGFARVSGSPGVVITTSGPGITNAITALATAYADSIPVLAISPGPLRGTVGRDIGWLHELKNQQAALASVCETSIRVESAEEIPVAIASAFASFATGRPRPVHIEIPVDVLEGSWTRTTVEVQEHPVRAPSSPITGIVDALEGATRPLLIAGGGARRASGPILALANRGLRVLTTVNGKGVLDEGHASALGASIRLSAAHSLANEADVLIIVGSELGDSDLWGGTIAPGGDDRKIIRIDIDRAQLHKNVDADIAVQGDANSVLHDIAQSLEERKVEWTSTTDADRQLITIDALRDAGPWALIQQVLCDAMPPGTVIAGDSSQVTYYGTVHFWPFNPDNRLLYPTGYATLGYGLPAAIGAKIADPGRPVIVLVGDGAAMFSIQELITATELQLPLPVVIVDNGGYAEIREQMLERGIEPQAVDLYRPDMVGLARAIGAFGVEAKHVTDIGALAREALLADRPTVIYHSVHSGRSIDPRRL